MTMEVTGGALPESSLPALCVISEPPTGWVLADYRLLKQSLKEETETGCHGWTRQQRVEVIDTLKRMETQHPDWGMEAGGGSNE